MTNGKGWSVNGAVSIQSEAHANLERAISEKRAYEVWLGNCKLTTCSSLRAAQMWVGKSTRYTIKQQV